MASSIGSVNDNQTRTSVSGLKFGPDWMRNPPQQEPIPQRQFALARNRYGREEMLQIFEQISSKKSDMTPPDELSQIPADFPEMVDNFQVPVAYQSPPSERRELPRDSSQQNQSGIGTVPRHAAGRGQRTFVANRGGNGWDQPRARIGSSRSDLEDNWRAPREAKAEPPADSDGWNKAGRVQPGQPAWKPKNQKRGAPEWMFTSNESSGQFDSSGNFTEDIPDDSIDNDENESDFESRKSELSQNLSEPPVAEKPSHSPPDPVEDHVQAPVLRVSESYQAPPSTGVEPSPTGPPGMAPSNDQSSWFEALTMEWFYKDPNGHIQGPFGSKDMGEWYSLGYFNDDLLVRRSVDQQFMPLGQALTRYGSDPFRSTRHPPPVKSPIPSPAPVQAPAPVPPVQAPPPVHAPAPLPAHIAPSVMAPPQRSPIDEIVFLIQTNQQHQLMFRQLMMQIASLDQYKGLPQNQQEQLVLQHMAAMQQCTPMINIPNRTIAQPPPPAMSQQHHIDQEVERNRLIEEEEAKQARKIEEEKLRIENEKRKALEFETMLRVQEEELKKREDQLRQQESMFKQQQRLARKIAEERRLQELREEEELRRQEEEALRAKHDEEMRQLESHRQREAEHLRLQELEIQKNMEEQMMREEHNRVIQQRLLAERTAEEHAQQLLEKAEHERMRKETEEKRRKKEEEKLLQKKQKADAERKKLEAEQLAKRKEQMRAELEKSTRKENEEKEKKRKHAEKAAQKAREAAPKWNTSVVSGVSSIPSFKDLQMKDHEEMQKIEKRKEVENEKKRAESVVVAAQVKGPSGWAGLVRGGSKNAPVPVSPVVAPKTTSKNPAQSLPKKNVSKNGAKAQKTKTYELGFWDSAVTAVLTEPNAVNKVMSAPSKKSQVEVDAESANTRHLFEKLTLVEDPLLAWARIELEIVPNSEGIDIPTFVSFLRDVEHDYEVEDYSRQYFGNGKEVLTFAHNFIEKRKSIRAGTNPKKSSKKKKNKNKATADFLGFTPAAGDQRNREGQLEGHF